MTLEPEAVAPAPEATMSPWQRAARIFVRPAAAWDGLQNRAQWFWPLLLIVLVSVVATALVYDSVIVPMQMGRVDAQVESGQLTPEQAARVEEEMSGPVAMAFGVGTQLVAVPVMFCLIALVVWFGCGFVLGTKFKYRHALEVICWSSLVNVPAQILTYVLGWTRGTFEGVHLGLAALLPTQESPSKLMSGLGIFLDQIGPFQIWYLVVAILGASALSGAPRKNTAWVLVSLYLALTLFFSAVGAVFAPSAG
jgi:hypothetical protein